MCRRLAPCSRRRRVQHFTVAIDACCYRIFDSLLFLKHGTAAVPVLPVPSPCPLTPAIFRTLGAADAPASGFLCCCAKKKLDLGCHRHDDTEAALRAELGADVAPGSKDAIMLLPHGGVRLLAPGPHLHWAQVDTCIAVFSG